MDINKIIDNITGFCGGPWAALLALIALVLFVIQLWYWLRVYAGIAKYRGSKLPVVRKVEGISVIVIVGDNLHWFETGMPHFLAQKGVEMELVVIEVDTSPDFSDVMKDAKKHFPNLTSVRIETDPRFPLNNKTAFNVGIKSARYENIILTTADTRPVSTKWLECMAQGFERGEVLIAYAGLERKPGFANGLMRSQRLAESVRYLSAAIKGKPYRGILANLGFTKTVYFDNRGFDHLNMYIGEDDLFVQKIVLGASSAVVMNPHATVRETVWGGYGAWWSKRRLLNMARRYYPQAVRARTEWEMGSRFLLLASVIAGGIILPWQAGTGFAVLWIARTAIVCYKMSLVRKRFGEKRLGLHQFLFDIAEPFGEAVNSLSRKLKPAKRVWRM